MKFSLILAAACLLVGGFILSGCNDRDSKKSVDAVPYDRLVWAAGGGNYAGAALTDERLTGLTVAPPNMAVAWGSDLSSWGYDYDQASAYACLFCEVNGQWLGGKFEWISRSRSTREFKNIYARYNGWNPAWLTAKKFAFVVVNKQGTKRTNVVMCELK